MIIEEFRRIWVWNGKLDKLNRNIKGLGVLIKGSIKGDVQMTCAAKDLNKTDVI